VDTSVDYQTLVGFGAGVSYIDDEIANYSDSAALYDAMFAESGFEVLRLRNRRDTGSVDLAGSAEIVEAAEERLGRAPTLLLTSSSPPGELKADGQRLCPGNVETCTLARAADGNFDYAGFAEYWRASLEEYAAQGVEPDYISIQNDPNWVPPEQAPLEACRFLPTEGTATVSVNGSDVEVEYAGYAEALAAVQDELAGLPVVPRIAAPEATSVSSTVEFAQELDMGRVDALAHHMYSTDPRAVDRDTLRALADLGQANSRPIFQTEMIAEGLETAMLIHEALGTIGASVYLQNDFVGSAGLTTPNRTALISLHEEEFTLEDTYYAMRHFARYTEPGWVRVAAEPDTGSVLATAWESPDSAAVTVVLVNPELAEAVVEIAFTEQPSNTQVIRTVFPGSERAAELGPLPPNNIVTLPGESIVTVAVRR
jgi:glucuronoarabinoxylan endo-1,4-beta-xylanase